MTTAVERMRDALVGELHLRMKPLGATLADVALTVDAALEATGYEALAAFTVAAETALAQAGGEIETPSPELEAALADLQSARESVASNELNADLVVLP
jgi:hypothetical protein